MQDSNCIFVFAQLMVRPRGDASSVPVPHDYGEKHHVVHIAQVCEAGVEVDPVVNHNIKEVLHGDASLADPWSDMLPSACTLHEVLE